MLLGSFFFSKLACSRYYQLHQLWSIRKSLTTETCHTLVRALIISRLDYCNSLLGGIPRYLLDQLEGVLRAAACLILQRPRTDHITDAMHRHLHWLDASSHSNTSTTWFFLTCLYVALRLHPSPVVPCYIWLLPVSWLYQPIVLPRLVGGHLRSHDPLHGTRSRQNCTTLSRNSSKLFYLGVWQRSEFLIEMFHFNIFIRV